MQPQNIDRLESPEYLSEGDLLTSDLVANSTMNRARGLSGVNSYRRELSMDIAQWLHERSESGGEVVWIDLCCGKGKALNEAAGQISTEKCPFGFYGVDLIDDFDEPTAGVKFLAGDVLSIELPERADLITCVHGLHYLGDKLGILQKVGALLKPNGLFVGHLDLRNIVIDGKPVERLSEIALFQKLPAGSLALKRGILSWRHIGPIKPANLRYLGAAPSRVPHSSGITVIDSFYTS